ncbi:MULTISPECIES: helix-turn-helix domain-containing protein [unclassified Parabacteroides]|uniref:helix-turn-helix domain-containing protein n=2 Tax=unclassified Parabacteroides TaxID=2649774 RepID=UPI0024748788|nr:MULTISPECIES: helix-turn-helix domain-containing protein [unclassified Parabacteroides]
MSFSEKLKSFDSERKEFTPYGLTCELWHTNIMPKPDRHNEIEINYFPESSITYLFHDRKITIPPKKLTLFWGLIPHQIVDYEQNSPYFVCTIPLSCFLEWKLPALIVDHVLKGRIIVDPSSQFAPHDEFMLANWLRDINQSNNVYLILLEMQARLLRMAKRIDTENNFTILYEHEPSLIEQMAIYITRNYMNPIRVGDIGKAVGLHPDYANAIFKKVFGCSIYEYIIQERITHAQRKLVLSDMSISDVAFDCGFNSLNRFHATFLKTNGCTPREYRNLYAASEKGNP